MTTVTPNLKEMQARYRDLSDEYWAAKKARKHKLAAEIGMRKFALSRNIHSLIESEKARTESADDYANRMLSTVNIDLEVPTEREAATTQLSEISYVMAMASNQLAKDGHEEMVIDMDDMRARLLAIHTAASERETDLLAVLFKVVNGTTRTMGLNSIDQEYAHVTQDVLDLGRETLRKYGIANVSERS